MLEQLKEFGAAYILVMVLVTVVFILDFISIVRCLAFHREELHDYAEFMIKYAKILMLAVFGGYFVLQTLDDNILTGVKAIHIAVGAMALTDAAASLIIKLKYHKKDEYGDPIKKDSEDIM